MTYEACPAAVGLQVSGMAKFPFLSLESDCVEMGDVVVGQTAEAYVRFGNHSPVPANFFLAAGPGSHDGAITVHPMRCAALGSTGNVQHRTAASTT